MVDYQKMTVATLRSRLRALELDTKGKKDELIARLQEAEGDVEESEEEKPKPTPKAKPAAKKGGRKIKKIDDEDSDDEEPEEEKEEEKVEEEESAMEEESEAPVADASMTVAELKKLCKERGLSTAGRKNDLIERLNNEGGEDEDEEEAEAAEAAQTKKRSRAQMKAPAPKRSTRAKKPVEPESESESESESSESSEEEPAAKKTKNIGKATVDPNCALANRGATVYSDYDCMLNQTNIANNNNKFYVIQVVQQGGTYYTFTRWGRVGETGRNKCEAGPSRDRAIANFEKKFKQKTGNIWGQPFTPKAKLYTQIEMSYEDTEDMAEKLAQLEGDEPVRKTVTLPSKLDKPTQEFLSLIFNEDMFKEQMVKFDLDVKKMPLGQLSKKQIEEGYKVLTKLNRALESSAGRSRLETLTNEFYTKIPHSFGRTRPPLLSDAETIRSKMEMLAVLGDIEIAVNLGEDASEKRAAKTKKTKEGDVIQKPNPLDEHYRTLKCDLDWVDPDSEEFDTIQTYATNTGAAFRKPKITNLWRTERDGTAKRFAEHDDVENRKLLWHGTNIAVVAAILNSGLRIMPHSGGRVGRGIYFASENGKSAAYVSCSGKTGVMFLGEAVLGREHHITVDDPSLRAAPAGYESIVAKGRVEPDPAGDVEMEFDGHTVVVPTGKPIPQPEFSGSRFQNSEYLVYKESQARLRYVMTVEFTR